MTRLRWTHFGLLLIVALLAAAPPAAAEMIAYYPFDNTLNDSSPNAYHLAMGDLNPDYSSSIKIAGTGSFKMNFSEGSNFDFHPHRSVANMPKLTTMTARQNLTITIWFRSTDIFANPREVLATGKADGTDQLFYASQFAPQSAVWADFVDSGGFGIGTQGYNLHADASPPYQSAEDVWQFIAMTWNGFDPLPFPGRADIYTGRLGQNHLQHLSNEWTSGFIRADTDPTNNYFALASIYDSAPYTSGYFDEMAIWDETLTASNITNLFRLGSVGISVPEPSGLALLTAGGMMVLARRRARKELR